MPEPALPVDSATLLLRLGVALGLGLLVGLQRERQQGQERLGGVRTFPLIALTAGALTAAAPVAGPWPAAAGLLALAAVIVMSNVAALRRGTLDPGTTTEVAALAVYAVGVLAVAGPLSAAVALGGVVAVLLHAKAPLHAFVNRLGEQDVRAIMRFALITLVILPALPDRTFGPYSVLNPRQIWMMAALVVGVSLLGYVAHRLLSARAGALLNGALGGLISSTATTIAYARRARQVGVGAAVLVMLVAAAVMDVRVYVLAGAVSPALARALAPPLAVLLAAALLPALAVFLLLRSGRRGKEHSLRPDNPAELRPALLFAGLYALVLLAGAWAQDLLGGSGFYIVAALSGLTDMDAVTLTAARLVAQEALALETAWRAVVVASLANLVFKAVAVFVIGGARIGFAAAGAFAIVGAAGAAALLLF